LDQLDKHDTSFIQLTLFTAAHCAAIGHEFSLSTAAGADNRVDGLKTLQERERTPDSLYSLPSVSFDQTQSPLISFSLL
jgi:hypothetical protein